MHTGKRIGIFGGTFDPIHIGHLVIAEAAREEYALERVIFVPAAHPPHKLARFITPEEDRLAMVRLATESNPYFEVSDVEIRRPGLSYTVDTLRWFHTQFPPDTEFYFILGMDTLLELPTWKYIDELLELTHFIGALRPHYERDPEKVIAHFGRTGRERIHALAVPQLEISATDLRNRMENGRSVRYFIPAAVREYVIKNGIYRGQEHVE